MKICWCGAAGNHAGKHLKSYLTPLPLPEFEVAEPVVLPPRQRRTAPEPRRLDSIDYLLLARCYAACNWKWAHTDGPPNAAQIRDAVNIAVEVCGQGDYYNSGGFAILRSSIGIFEIILDKKLELEYAAGSSNV